jgi:hypothetical protein
VRERFEKKNLIKLLSISFQVFDLWTSSVSSLKSRAQFAQSLSILILKVNIVFESFDVQLIS